MSIKQGNNFISRPTIRERPRREEVYTSLRAAGVESWLADLLARRLERPWPVAGCFAPPLDQIADPINIPDMAKAVSRIVAAIVAGEHIVFMVDHDLDGQAAAAVLWSAFVEHFRVDPGLLAVESSHRLTEGYGITEAVGARLIASTATLIITADLGSSDEARIRKIKAAGKEVIVTDHHLLPREGYPLSAHAVVNPMRDDSGYDSCICGAAVAFLTLAKVRTALLAQGVRQEIPAMGRLLDYVALATIADCVALRPDLAATNRALVSHGLMLINQGTRPCWRAIKEKLSGRITAEEVSFQIAPVIAAAGRLDWAEPGFRFLVAGDDRQAKELWQGLQEINQTRKTLERQLTARAIEAAARDQTPPAIVLYFEDGHCGVHGITASRLVELFGKAAAVFAPKGAGAVSEGGIVPTDGQGRRLASGSFRSAAGGNIRAALQAVAERDKELLYAFGGHAGAAGATIAVDDFPRFAKIFAEEIGRQSRAGEAESGPTLWVDGELAAERISLASVDTLLTLDPWGRDFPAPLFRDLFTVLEIKAIGDGTHLRLLLRKNDLRLAAIWFGALAAGEPPPCQAGEEVIFVYQLRDNFFRGQRSLQLQIVAREESSFVV